jgi:hypothetical protein
MAAVTFLRLTTGSSCHHQVLRLHQLERLRRPPQTAHYGNRKQINCGSQSRANCSTRHWHMTVIVTHIPASRLMSHRCMRCGGAGGWVFCRASTSLCSRESLCTSLSTVDKHLSLSPLSLSFSTHAVAASTAPTRAVTSVSFYYDFFVPNADASRPLHAWQGAVCWREGLGRPSSSATAQRANSGVESTAMQF